MPTPDRSSALVTRVVDILAAAGLKPLIFEAERDDAKHAGAELLRGSGRTAGLPLRAARTLSRSRPRG